MEKHVEQRVEDVTYNKAKLWQIILFAMNNSSTNIYLVAFYFRDLFIDRCAWSCSPVC